MSDRDIVAGSFSADIVPLPPKCAVEVSDIRAVLVRPGAGGEKSVEVAIGMSQRRAHAHDGEGDNAEGQMLSMDFVEVGSSRLSVGVQEQITGDTPIASAKGSQRRAVAGYATVRGLSAGGLVYIYASVRTIDE